MSSKQVVLYDTTLRDGAQTEGISLSVSDKLQICERLDDLGIPYIEGGWPASNPKEMEFFRRGKRLRLKKAVLTCFGSTRKANTSVGKDPQIQSLLAAGTEVVTVFGKSWDLHVRDVFRVPLEENLRMIADTVGYLKRRGLTVMYDAEHFFDGYRENPEYAMKTLKAAAEEGAGTLILCDTNGGSIPSAVAAVVGEVRRRFPAPLGIHCHNDTDLAVANSIAAVEAGVLQIQGTINGYGERCGNANLCSIIPVLQLKMGYRCVPPARLKTLSEAAHFVAEVCNMRPDDHQPFVGPSAFAHKGGVHINAVKKNPRTYEQIDPSAVGNRRRILVSELGGKSTILEKAQELRLELGRDAEEAKRFLKRVQELEAQGYHFEAAEGSLELLMQRAYKRFKRFFDLQGFRVMVEKDEKGAMTSEAAIKLKVDGVTEHSVAEGDGPVHALDKALRKALAEFYPAVAEMRLVDFKVRVLESRAGTAARVRVLIESQDAKESWWTMGVSENIIEASWQALVDSIEYKLLKDRKA
ncbi:MAG: citramalate synthase [Candidatus Omnitrophica bacterium]|nr:citramalate synthase [Candidatus Omnitrophota bacterium]